MKPGDPLISEGHVSTSSERLRRRAADGPPSDRKDFEVAVFPSMDRPGLWYWVVRCHLRLENRTYSTKEGYASTEAEAIEDATKAMRDLG